MGMYIQTKMAEFAEDLWELMQSPKTHIYMCGLKGMESGMEECFAPLADKNGMVWKEFAKSMKKAKRYHVEVYREWRRGCVMLSRWCVSVSGLVLEHHFSPQCQLTQALC